MNKAMFKNRYRERKVFPCPVLKIRDKERFSVNKGALKMLERKHRLNPDISWAIAEVRKDEEGSPYVDIYTVDWLTGYRHFIIFPGYCMSEKEEKAFLHFTYQPEVIMDSKSFGKLNRDIPNVFPEWHWPGYVASETGVALQHLYFASHWNGPREILVKAGIPLVSFMLDSFFEYDMYGSTPSEIVHLPLRLLRVFSKSKDLLDTVTERQGFELARKLYRRFCARISDSISIGQYRYLEDVESGLWPSFSSVVFNNLYWDTRGEFYPYYHRFLELKNKVDAISKYRLPEPWEIPFAIERLEIVSAFLDHSSPEVIRIDQQIAERATESAYGYSNGMYAVRYPLTGMEICKEGLEQHNCLVDMDYIRRHSEAKTTILFIRQTSQEENVFVTMEIQKRSIIQVFGKFNKRPPLSVLHFLEEFAERMNIKYNPFELYKKNIDEELATYLNDFSLRKQAKQML